ncbi:hypothetical protein VTG60DRAFT_3111 [Thermothelomyces hinnuleus]
MFTACSLFANQGRLEEAFLVRDIERMRNEVESLREEWDSTAAGHAEQQSADGVTYEADIQDRFTALDRFITDCGTSLWRSAWNLRRIRVWNALQAGSSPKSADTESPDIKIYNTLTSMREKCETAAHQFLRKSWKYDGKELDDIAQFMEELCHNATNGDVGLDSLGAHNEKALVSADGEKAEKPLYEEDAGLELRSLERSRVDHA